MIYPEDICSYDEIRKLWQAAKGTLEEKDASIFKIYPKLMFFERKAREGDAHKGLEAGEVIRVMNPRWPFMDNPNAITKGE